MPTRLAPGLLVYRDNIMRRRLYGGAYPMVAKCICTVIISILGIGVPYAVAVNVEVVAVGTGGLGVVILNLDKGSVAFCTDTNGAGLPPIPEGKCANIGSVGLSVLGYTMTPTGISVFIINKTNGNVFQCVAAENPFSGTPSGACKQIAHTGHGDADVDGGAGRRPGEQRDPRIRGGRVRREYGDGSG